MAATPFWKGCPQLDTYTRYLQPPQIVKVSYFALFDALVSPKTGSTSLK